MSIYHVVQCSSLNLKGRLEDEPACMYVYMSI